MRDYMDRQATPPKRVTSKKLALRRSQVICTLTSPHTYEKEMGRSLRNFAPYTIRISTSRYFSFFASQDSLRCLNTPVLGCLRLFKKILIKLQSKSDQEKPLGGFAACRAIISCRCESRKLFNGVRNQNSKRKLNIILKNIARPILSF